MKKISIKIPNIKRDNYPYGEDFVVKENGDSISQIYEQGYLPVFVKESSGDNMIFYLNRGVRIDLSNFELSSENRRVLRKTDYLDHELLSLDKFEYDPIKVGKFCYDNFKARFPDNPMHISKIKRIFTSGINTDLFIYYDKEQQSKVIGYATCLIADNLLHYTFPFADINYYKQNLGMGMMLRAILWAQEHKKKYIYLGTCNSEPAFYKLQFKGVEWFDGNSWNKDMKRLKISVRDLTNKS